MTSGLSGYAGVAACEATGVRSPHVRAPSTSHGLHAEKRLRYRLWTGIAALRTDQGRPDRRARVLTSAVPPGRTAAGDVRPQRSSTPGAAHCALPAPQATKPAR